MRNLGPSPAYRKACLKINEEHCHSCREPDGVKAMVIAAVLGISIAAATAVGGCMMKKTSQYTPPEAQPSPTVLV